MVPVPPELTALLHEYVTEFGTGSDGRMFPGGRAAELAKLAYMRAWRSGRRLAFTPEVAVTPLAATPYTLRHACVSTWLNGGVPAAQVAEWAGHVGGGAAEGLREVSGRTGDEVRRRVMRRSAMGRTTSGAWACIGRRWPPTAGADRRRPDTTRSAPHPVDAGEGPFLMVIRMVPPAGFEPAPPPPEGGALSPELRGPCDAATLAHALTYVGSGCPPRSASSWRR
jgi:hypothetical protein